MKLLPNLSIPIREQGQRSNNEDYMIHGDLPENKGSFFAVCDGVGGANKGEVASELTCQSIKEFLQKEIPETYDQHYIDRMIDFVENEFDNYIDSHSEAQGMATTMALLILDADKAIIAHIGDSRVYHIRYNKILFKTQDHSLVNMFVKNGEITEEEALTHPQRNVIMRAIQGKNKPTKADVKIIENKEIEKLDYFFLCSDGILETITDSILLQILCEEWDNIKKMNFIKEKCTEFSRDNYSAYLVQIIKNVVI